MVKFFTAKERWKMAVLGQKNEEKRVGAGCDGN